MAATRHHFEQARQAQDVRLVVDTIPTLAWSARSDGSADFFNQRWLDYTGLSAEQARDWGWTAALHPDDLNGLVDYWRSILAAGEPGEIEGRLRRFDGEYRWFLFRATPSFDNDGRAARRRESRSGDDCQGQFAGIHSRSPMPGCRTDHQRMLLQHPFVRSQWLENPAGS